MRTQAWKGNSYSKWWGWDFNEDPRALLLAPEKGKGKRCWFLSGGLGSGEEGLSCSTC